MELVWVMGVALSGFLFGLASLCPRYSCTEVECLMSVQEGTQSQWRRKHSEDQFRGKPKWQCCWFHTANRSLGM